MTARLARLLTLREVADLLGAEGPAGLRRVRRLLRAHASSSEFVVCVGAGKGARYRVSLPALRRHFPQVKHTEEDLLPLVRAEVRRQVEELDEQVTDTRDAVEALARETARRLADLGARVDRCERPRETTRDRVGTLG